MVIEVGRLPDLNIVELSMELRTLGRGVLKSMRREKGHFLDYYTNNFRDIRHTIEQFDGSKVHLRPRSKTDALEQVRFSVFSHDLAILNVPPVGEAQMRGQLGTDTKSLYDLDIRVEESITRDPDFLSQDGSFFVRPVFVAQTGPIAKEIADEIAPLLMRGRTIIEAERGLVTHDRVDETGRGYWKMHMVDPDSPTELWTVSKSRGQQVPPLVSSNRGDSDEVSLFNVALPFISGIGFYDLAKVLDDEEAHLSKARLALKNVVKEASAKGNSLDEVINDVLRPELDSVSRRLQAVESSRALKQGGAVIGTAVISLVGLLTGGFLQLAAAAGGAGGFGVMVKNEADALERQKEIAESPYYLIWKLRELRRK